MVASSGTAEKVKEAVGAAHQLTVEAWVIPTNTSQVEPIGTGNPRRLCRPA